MANLRIHQFLPAVSGDFHCSCLAGQQRALWGPRDPRGPRAGGPKGLSNLGNTCYLASVVQCLAQTETFTRELLNSGGPLGPPGVELHGCSVSSGTSLLLVVVGAWWLGCVGWCCLLILMLLLLVQVRVETMRLVLPMNH